MELSPMLVPGQGYVADAPSGTTTLANTKGAEGEGTIEFSDVLDAINPLQHLPIISTIYREATGSEIKTLPNLIGGAIFGGVFGLIGAAVDSVVKEASGASIGHHLLAAVGLADDAKTPDVTVTDVATGEVVSSTEQDKAAAAATAAYLKDPSRSIMLDEINGQPAWFRAERDQALLLAMAGGGAARTNTQDTTARPTIARTAEDALAQDGKKQRPTDAQLQAAAAAAPAQAAPGEPTEFFRSMQRANAKHKDARPLSGLASLSAGGGGTLSPASLAGMGAGAAAPGLGTAAMGGAPLASMNRATRTTATGATANNAVAAAAPAPAASPAPDAAPAPASVGAPTSILPPSGANQPSLNQAQQALQANPEGFRNEMMAALQKYQALKANDGAQKLSITQ